MLNKVITDLKSALAAKADVDAQIITEKDLRAKEEAYNSELLKAVSLLTSVEKRDKSFFRKFGEQLTKVLKAATSPAHLVTIVSLIVLVKKL